MTDRDWQVDDLFYASCIPSDGLDPKGTVWSRGEGAVICRIAPNPAEIADVCVYGNVVLSENEEFANERGLYFNRNLIRPVDPEDLDTIRAALALTGRIFDEVFCKES